ncbi:hypothetical protein [Streptomyces sp. 3214.6]|uniref:hypothetical protein n=1 Tax=Streptomyces sp. 3214.6 TaxID=1882757 RepID=UPI00090C056C|nr:hypothetical protein [Streptomyces sp. 3214.6]SHI19828.1 hypothetical protein SAMN05444521_5223 [Streptomyces sp. 3214.6]
MTNPPPSKSVTPAPDQPSAAEPALSLAAGGVPRVAARQGVSSALAHDPDAVIVTGIWPGLQVQFTSPPVADWLCSCGHHERARGRAAVIELTTRVKVGHCPHRTAPAQEGRAAA